MQDGKDDEKDDENDTQMTSIILEEEQQQEEEKMTSIVPEEYLVKNVPVEMFDKSSTETRDLLRDAITYLCLVQNSKAAATLSLRMSRLNLQDIEIPRRAILFPCLFQFPDTSSFWNTMMIMLKLKQIHQQQNSLRRKEKQNMTRQKASRQFKRHKPDLVNLGKVPSNNDDDDASDENDILGGRQKTALFQHDMMMEKLEIDSWAYFAHLARLNGRNSISSTVFDMWNYGRYWHLFRLNCIPHYEALPIGCDKTLAQPAPSQDLVKQHDDKNSIPARIYSVEAAIQIMQNCINAYRSGAGDDVRLYKNIIAASAIVCRYDPQAWWNIFLDWGMKKLKIHLKYLKVFSEAYDYVLDAERWPGQPLFHESLFYWSLACFLFDVNLAVFEKAVQAQHIPNADERDEARIEKERDESESMSHVSLPILRFSIWEDSIRSCQMIHALTAEKSKSKNSLQNCLQKCWIDMKPWVKSDTNLTIALLEHYRLRQAPLALKTKTARTPARTTKQLKINQQQSWVAHLPRPIILPRVTEDQYKWLQRLRLSPQSHWTLLQLRSFVVDTFEDSESNGSSAVSSSSSSSSSLSTSSTHVSARAEIQNLKDFKKRWELTFSSRDRNAYSIMRLYLLQDALRVQCGMAQLKFTTSFNSISNSRILELEDPGNGTTYTSIVRPHQASTATTTTTLPLVNLTSSGLLSLDAKLLSMAQLDTVLPSLATEVLILWMLHKSVKRCFLRTHLMPFGGCIPALYDGKTVIHPPGFRPASTLSSLTLIEDNNLEQDQAHLKRALGLLQRMHPDSRWIYRSVSSSSSVASRGDFPTSVTQLRPVRHPFQNGELPNPWVMVDFEDKQASGLQVLRERITTSQKFDDSDHFEDDNDDEKDIQVQKRKKQKQQISKKRQRGQTPKIKKKSVADSDVTLWFTLFSQTLPLGANRTIVDALKTIFTSTSFWKEWWVGRLMQSISLSEECVFHIRCELDVDYSAASVDEKITKSKKKKATTSSNLPDSLALRELLYKGVRHTLQLFNSWPVLSSGSSSSSSIVLV